MSKFRSRVRRRQVAAAIILGAVGSTALTSQEKPSASPTPDSGIVIRQTVRRVRIDVIVTDGQGRAVSGLHSSDFQLSEDGKAQAIRHFEWHDDAQVTVPPRPAMAPHMFMNLPQAPERGPMTVLLFDVLNTPLDAQPYARTQMLDFLKKNKGRQTAIFILSDRLHMLQGFTTDGGLLEQAANRPGTMPQSSSQMALAPSQTTLLTDTFADQMSTAQRQMAADSHSANAPVTPSSTAASLANSAEIMAHMEAAEASALLDSRVEITLDALAQIGRFLAGVQGRKNLIWYSGSFPAGILPNPDVSPGRDDAIRNYGERMRAATNLLNSAEVAVYPVDARGLQTNSAFTAANSGRPPSNNTPLSFGGQLASEFATMDSIGDQTGGRAFYSTNGLEEALNTASQDGSAYYSLFYAPSNTKYDGSVRRVSVKLGHGHYHLAYRKSYFADDADSRAKNQSSAQNQNNAAIEPLRAAMQPGTPPAHQLVFSAQVDPVGAPFPATPTQMKVLTPYLEIAAKAARQKYIPPSTPIQVQMYAVQYAILASQLDFPLCAQGNIYRPHLSLAALAFNADGVTLSGANNPIEGAISASEIENVRENGYRVVQVFLVPVDAAMLRLVIRDENNGRIGSMEIPLPLPPGK